MKARTYLVSLLHQVRARYAGISDEQKPIALLLVGVFCILTLILLNKFYTTISVHIKKTAPHPLLIRRDNIIIIPEDSPLRSKMVVQTVDPITAPHIVPFPGEVEADPSRTVNVQPPFVGRLIAIKIHLGDVVKRNQLLAVIRSPGQAQAYSDLDKARSALKLTSDAFNRAKKVNDAGANAIKDIQLAESNYLQALAEFKRTIAVLKASGKNSFSLLKIRAPIDGMVTAINYGIGSYINDPTSALLTINNIKSVFVTAEIPENYLGAIVKGLPVKVTLNAFPNQIIKANITFVNSILEADTRRNKTRIRLKNSEQQLKPNMFAVIKISIPLPSQIMIPLSALLMNNDTTTVFIEKCPWTFVRRQIQLGMEDGNKVRVIKGLKAGDRIVTNGGVLVND